MWRLAEWLRRNARSVPVSPRVSTRLYMPSPRFVYLRSHRGRISPGNVSDAEATRPVNLVFKDVTSGSGYFVSLLDMETETFI